MRFFADLLPALCKCYQSLLQARLRQMGKLLSEPGQHIGCAHSEVKQLESNLHGRHGQGNLAFLSRRLLIFETFVDFVADGS